MHHAHVVGMARMLLFPRKTDWEFINSSNGESITQVVPSSNQVRDVLGKVISTHNKRWVKVKAWIRFWERLIHAAGVRKNTSSAVEDPSSATSGGPRRHRCGGSSCFRERFKSGLNIAKVWCSGVDNTPCLLGKQQAGSTHLIVRDWTQCLLWEVPLMRWIG